MNKQMSLYIALCVLGLSFFFTGVSQANYPHADLVYEQYPANCLGCHKDEAHEVHASTHYQWLGEAPDMTNGTSIPQGKLTNAVNSYCINIEGNWPVCGSCHAGRGKRPDDPTAGLENIDCLICHNTEYASARTRLPDGSLGVATPSDSMVQNIHDPTRANCLKCHATAGGGDGVKRGDLSLALIDNTDEHFDYQKWLNAFEKAGIDPGFYAHRQRSLDEVFPWSHIDVGVTGAFLKQEYQRSLEAIETSDCRCGACNACGLERFQTVCQEKIISQSTITE